MGLAKRIHAQRAAGRIAFGSASNADPILGAIDRRSDARKAADIRRPAPAVAATLYGLFVDLEPREGRE
jgi:hypothetical protein